MRIELIPTASQAAMLDRYTNATPKATRNLLALMST